MRVMVVGLRGFPDVQGGVETHCEELYPRLVKLGCEVEILVRSVYMTHYDQDEYQGVKFVRLPTLSFKGLEAILHTFFAVLYAGASRPDILHIHAIGPALFAPLARLFGLKVIITHHGFDYDRVNWGAFAKKVLRLGEMMGIRFSNQRIVVAQYISDSIKQRMGKESIVVPNGVNISSPSQGKECIESVGLQAGRYILHVGRLVPEKQQLELIEAFLSVNKPEWKLAIVGSTEGNSSYLTSVSQLAESAPGVVLTGFQTGEALRQLYSHAGLFVLPSTHEGLPIALLEALSYGLPVLVSDIPAHREVALDADDYIPNSDKESFFIALNQAIGKAALKGGVSVESQKYIANQFNWDEIAVKTLAVYKNLHG